MKKRNLKTRPSVSGDRLLMQRKPISQLVGKTFNGTLTRILSSVRGIGRSNANRILCRFGLRANTKIVNLQRPQSLLTKTEQLLPVFHLITGDTLRKQVEANVMQKVKDGSTRGQQFLKGLPVHNQRTKTNASTCKKQRQARQQTFGNRTIEIRKVSGNARKAVKSKK
jgi:ribosomal protein S13